MKTMRKTVTLFASALLAAASVCAAGFEKTLTYSAGQFTDVAGDAWYASAVASAYELGLMNGIGGGLFDPEGDVTVAEAVTMAARAAAINAGETIPAAEGEWYAMYVNYASSKGFLGTYDTVDRPAKRWEVAELFCKAMPQGYYTAVNSVDFINDVSAKKPYHDDLLTLYRAGVVMGSDAYGNFNPENNITRAESAAIIGRVALPENRLHKSLDKISTDDAYVLVFNETPRSNREGINSGWLLDNRGAVPRTSLMENFFALGDIDENAPTAFIRELNKTTTGKIVITTDLLVSASDGAFLNFTNDKGETVYRVDYRGGGWELLTPDGYKPLLKAAESLYSYKFIIEIDLDNARSRTFINGAGGETTPLLKTGDDANLLQLRIETTKEGTPTVVLGAFRALVNYPLFEDFYFTKSGSGDVPFGWTFGENSAVMHGNLSVGDYATYAFDPVSGLVATEMDFLPDNAQNFTYLLRSDEKIGVAVTSDGKSLYANGVKVYDELVSTVWYVLQVKADTDTFTAKIKLNGREIAEVPFAETAASFNNIVVTSDKPLSTDDFRVYRAWERDDYVPAPVRPAGEEKWTVGMNVCSIWQNGRHTGWSNISAYDDREPVLGYYDEGKPETADWEIKYMVEHGIDFQAFCWYAQTEYQPLPVGNWNSLDHPLRGYMDAKYSDQMKYCIIWEAANAKYPKNLEQFQKYFAANWIEYFFKDDRYMTLDNKPLVYIFGAGNVISGLGGPEKTKEAFDWLREEVKKYGFDGVLFFTSHSSDSETLKKAGFDGNAGYNWGTAGYSLDQNKTSILNNANKGFTYCVPTISVGFNSLAWWSVRYPMMSMTDYRAAWDWVKDEYLPKYAKEDWQKNFVHISTWNEYGEGTFIMPTTDEKGFGYLDIIREAFTDEKADPAINTVPTAAQKSRITRLYPQYRHLLRMQDREKAEGADEELLYTIDYAAADPLSVGNVSGGEQTADGYRGTSTSGDPLLVYTLPEGLDLAKISKVRINLQTTSGNTPHFFWITAQDSKYNDAKRINFPAKSADMFAYDFDMASNKAWTGTLIGFRMDPGNQEGKDFLLKSVEFFGSNVEFSNVMTVNDADYELTFRPMRGESGDVLLAFDPDAGIDILLDLFHYYDADTKMLTVVSKEHTLVYTVGSSKFFLDGSEQLLPAAVTSLDGLPLLPLEQLCRDTGCKLSYVEKDGEKVVTIDTSDKDYLVNQREKNRRSDAWEFNDNGNNEIWESSKMNMLTADGYIHMETVVNDGDPQAFKKNLELLAPKYKALEMRVRYNYGEGDGNYMKMYFLTALDQTWNEAKCLNFRPHGHANSDGAWEVFTFDLAENENWRGVITNLRFDPFGGTGWMDVDYIRFIRDETYPYETVDDLPMEILNGDAEDTNNVKAFASHNGKVSIVDDPDGRNGHSWLVIPANPGARTFLYFTQECRFKAGMSYTVDFDVRVASDDQNLQPAADFEASIQFNPQFIDAKAVSAGVNHIVAGKKIKVSDGWTHFSCEFTVPENCTDRSKDLFSIYSNPSAANTGIGYYVDNITIAEQR